MDPEENKPVSPPAKKWKRPTVNEVGFFTVHPADHSIIRFFKSLVNYTVFGFVMFITGMVWLITILVV